jgi:hypothetical protein
MKPETAGMDALKPWKINSTIIALDHPWYRVRRAVVELPSKHRMEDCFGRVDLEVVIKSKYNDASPC